MEIATRNDFLEWATPPIKLSLTFLHHLYLSQLYAIGLNRTIAREDNRTITEKITDGAAIVRNIRGLKQRSITGQNYIVSSKADVQTYFEVLQVLDQFYVFHEKLS